MKARAVLVALVLLLGGCAARTPEQRFPVPIDDSPQRGPANAPVLIVEFLNYT